MFALISFISCVGIHVITELECSLKSLLFMRKFTFFSVVASRALCVTNQPQRRRPCTKSFPLCKTSILLCPVVAQAVIANNTVANLICKSNAIFNNFPWAQWFWGHRSRKWWESQSSESSSQSISQTSRHFLWGAVHAIPEWVGRSWYCDPWLTTKGHCSQLWPKRVDRR